MHAVAQGTVTPRPFLTIALIESLPLTVAAGPEPLGAPLPPGPGLEEAPPTSTVSQLETTSMASTTAVSWPTPQSIVSASPSRALIVSLPNGTLHE